LAICLLKRLQVHVARLRHLIQKEKASANWKTWTWTLPTPVEKVSLKGPRIPMVVVELEQVTIKMLI
jgi:hypothetical protein